MKEKSIQQIQEEAARQFDEGLKAITDLLKSRPDDKPGDRKERVEAVREAVDIYKKPEAKKH